MADAAGNKPPGASSNAPLLTAQAEAQAGNPLGMLEALGGSGFLEGLVRRLEKEWSGRLPRPEIEECVGLAADSAYNAVSNGKRVGNLGAWLWKAAANIAIDRWNDDYQHRAGVDGDEIADARRASEIEHESQQDLADHRRAEAVRLARKLLPRIGQGQLIDVMEVVIDAVDQRLQDLPASAIADTLGLSEAAVRSLLSRGLERLERAARDEGISLPTELPDVLRGLDVEDVIEK